MAKPAFVMRGGKKLREGSKAEEKTESPAFEKREDAGKGKGKGKKPFPFGNSSKSKGKR